MDLINNYRIPRPSVRIIVETLLNLGKLCKKYQLLNVDPGFSWDFQHASSATFEIISHPITQIGALDFGRFDP